MKRNRGLVLVTLAGALALVFALVMTACGGKKQAVQADGGASDPLKGAYYAGQMDGESVALSFDDAGGFAMKTGDESVSGKYSLITGVEVDMDGDTETMMLQGDKLIDSSGMEAAKVSGNGLINGTKWEEKAGDETITLEFTGDTLKMSAGGQSVSFKYKQITVVELAFDGGTAQLLVAGSSLTTFDGEVLTKGAKPAAGQ
jgi:hypothetical protein